MKLVEEILKQTERENDNKLLKIMGPNALTAWL